MLVIDAGGAVTFSDGIPARSAAAAGSGRQDIESLEPLWPGVVEHFRRTLASGDLVATDRIGDRTYRVQSTAIRDPEGRVQAVVLYGVPDRGATDELGRNLKDAILLTALDSIITIDSAGRIVEFNPAAESTFGFRRADVLGRTLSKTIIPHRYRTSHDSGMERYARTGEGPVLNRRIEIEALRADGEEFPCELAIIPIKLEGDVYFTAYLRDLTEVRKAERERRIARFTIEQAGEAVFWVDGSSRIVDANPAASKALGFEHGALMSMRISDIDLEMDAVKWTGHWEALRKLGTTVHESRLRASDGRSVPVEVRSNHVVVDGEALNCVFVRDISEHRASQASLLASQRRLELVLDSSGLGFWDLDLRSDRKSVNDRYLEVLGWSAPLFDLSAGAYDAGVHPDDLPAVRARLKAHLSGATPMFEVEYRFRREDGGYAWIRDRGRIVDRDEAGRPSRMIGTVEDVTSRRDEATRRSRLADLDRIVRRITGSFVSSDDLSGSIEMMLREVGQSLDVSRAYLFRLRPGGDILTCAHEWCAAGVPAEIDRLREVDLDTVGWCLEQLRSTGVLAIGDLRDARLPDILRVHLRTQGVQATIAMAIVIGGVFEGFIGFDENRQARDWRSEEITVLQAMVESFCRAIERQVDTRRQHAAAAELEAALARAEAASEAKGRFLANMSHELRTPLTSVIGMAEILSRGGASEADQARMVDQIRASGRHLLGTINDILDLSKIEAEKVEIRPAETEVSTILDTVRMFLSLAESKGLELKTVFEPGVPQCVHADGLHASQILANLLSNAVKYSDHGQIDVRVRYRERRGPSADEVGELHISVRDCGAGIDAATRRALFEPFDRGDTGVDGTGLGLAISRRLIELMGGCIDVESEPGAGSCFHISFPAPRRSSADLPAGIHEPRSLARYGGEERRRADGQRALAGKRLLLVEDTPQAAEVVRFFLEEAGAIVSWRTNGREAIEYLALEEPPDLILLDMRMQLMDGYETVRRLRAQGVRIPIVALTAHGMQQDRERCLAAGCDEHVAKPVDAMVMIEVCRRLMEGVRGRNAGVPEDHAPTSTASSSAIEELMDRYRRELPRLVADLERWVGEGRMDEVLDRVHQISGSAGNYGLPRISELAQACEQAIQERRGPAEIAERMRALVAAAVASETEGD